MESPMNNLSSSVSYFSFKSVVIRDYRKPSQDPMEL